MKLALYTIAGGVLLTSMFNSAIDHCAEKTNNRGLCQQEILQTAFNRAAKLFQQPEAGPYLVRYISNMPRNTIERIADTYNLDMG